MILSHSYLHCYYNTHHGSYRLNLQYHQYSTLWIPTKEPLYNIPVALWNASHGQNYYSIMPPYTLEYQYPVPGILGAFDCIIWGIDGTIIWYSDQYYLVTIGYFPYQKFYNNPHHG